MGHVTSRATAPRRLEESACTQWRDHVFGDQQGSGIIHPLYDHQAAECLDQTLFHVEHLRLGFRDDASRD
jgi:hypothetical protein